MFSGESMILIGIIMIISRTIFAIFMNQAALEKGYEKEAHAFAICFFLGILGGLYVIALPYKDIHEQNKEIINLLEKISNTDNKNKDE